MSTLALIHGFCTSHDWHEIDDRTFLSELPAMVARAIGCTRAGLRAAVATPSGRMLRTLAMYDQSAKRLVDVPDLAGAGVEPYLESLARQGGVMAADVRHHPLVLPLMLDYVESQDLRSLVDTAVSIDGMVYGTVVCEQLGSAQQWEPYQLHLLRRIALRAGPALARLMAGEVRP